MAVRHVRGRLADGSGASRAGTHIGPRVYVLGRRVHHGFVGAVLAGVGLALMVHDRLDFPWPLRDRS